MAESPPLNRFYVLGYAANDKDFPIISANLDPRVAGYKVPEDLSTCPDKRYPNHVFTGAQPLSGDERVRHVWEILPSPWVPFTRYDDDLGPIQGRRRSVKNEGQVAVLTSDKRTTYEAREGSAIVYTELEETWSIKTDEDGNSLFPIKDRDFYDASRGPVQERRQLFVPTGEEVGSLENVDGVITQTSYEPYNEFLSVKIVQTYSVDGPALVGKATDNDGQLVTVTTQRKGALNYVSPNPTATRTVEVNREDAEALIERIVDTPEIFKANTFSVERPDPIPQKFRVAVPIQSSQEIVEGDAEVPTLEEGEISKSEEQRNKFIKRVSSTSRDQAVLPQTLTGKSTNNERQEVTVTETLQFGNTAETTTATKTVESEALGDGNYVITKTQVDEVFAGQSYRKTREDLTPQKFRASETETTTETTVEGQANPSIALSVGEFAKSEQQINKFVKRVSTTSKVVATATILLESVLTPEGLLATRKLTLASGAQSFVPSATLVDANVEALGDGRTVKTEVTIPNIFEAKTVSVERPDPVPQKFRALVPSKTEQTNTIGSVNSSIDLTTGEIAKSETQQTQFVKRISSTSRDKSLLPRSLTQKATSEDRQIATITETLQSNDALETPTATLTVESEAIGDGSYVVRKTEVPEVFTSRTFSKERPDAVPQKFRVAIPATTEQETLEGIAREPDLAVGDLSKSEQQVNKFVKRISATSRVIPRDDDGNVIPQSITQVATDGDRQLVTITETFQFGDTESTPSATTTVESEALGDGTYVVRTASVGSVFDSKLKTISRPEVLPEQFRANLLQVTEQEIVEQGSVSVGESSLSGNDGEVVDGEEGQESLSDDILEKSEQRIDEYRVRRTTVKRAASGIPTLNGQEYEPSINITIPFKESITSSGSSIGTEATFVDPLSEKYDLVRKIDIASLKKQLEAILLSFPTRTSLSLPRVLKSVIIKWDGSAENSSFTSDWSGSAVGQSWSISANEAGRAMATASVSPSFEIDMEEIYANNIPTTSYFFFLPYPVTLAQILKKVDATAWPIFKPRSHVIWATGKSVKVSLDGSASASASFSQTSTSSDLNEGLGNGSALSLQTVSVTIPPSIHPDILIAETGTKKFKCKASINIGWSNYNILPSASVKDDSEVEIEGSNPTKVLSVKGPTDIPRSGKYLIDSKVEIYQYGFAKIYAEVLDASLFADTPPATS